MADHPIRTCVGCRGTGVRTELVRLVARRAVTAQAGEQDDRHDRRVDQVVIDARKRMDGRGAWIHATTRCWELAVQRRALGRALRLPGQFDQGEVEKWMRDNATDA